MAFALKQTLSLSVRRAGVTQLAECLLPKSERLSAVAPLVVIPPNRLSYTLSISADGLYAAIYGRRHLERGLQAYVIFDRRR